MVSQGPRASKWPSGPRGKPVGPRAPLLRRARRAAEDRGGKKLPAARAKKLPSNDKKYIQMIIEPSKNLGC